MNKHTSFTFRAALLVLALAAAGCKKSPSGPDAFSQNPGAAQDPASVNMASVPAGNSAPPARVLGEREQGYGSQQAEQYPESGYSNRDERAGEQALDEADQAPPPLPEYDQPAVTRANTVWTPGYWRNARSGYYWVPGAYVQPPYTGALWTPGYWGADGSRYRFHPGYWGRHVGFYGGVPYGGGYTGTGYRGGYWNGDRFYYNQAVNHVDINLIPTVYNQPEAMRYPYGRASYNGGNGGIPILPIAAELIALNERHVGGVRFQFDVERRAQLNRAQFYEFNHGRPETYFAGEDYVIQRPVVGRQFVQREVVRQPVIVERQVIVERDGFPGRGHAYGHYKNKDKHDGDEDGGHDKHGKDKGEHGHGHGRD